MHCHSCIPRWISFMCMWYDSSLILVLSVSFMLYSFLIELIQCWLWVSGMSVISSIFSRILRSLNIVMKSISDLPRILLAYLIILVAFEDTSVLSSINSGCGMLKSINMKKWLLRRFSWESYWRRITITRSYFHWWSVTRWNVCICSNTRRFFRMV